MMLSSMLPFPVRSSQPSLFVKEFRPFGSTLQAFRRTRTVVDFTFLLFTQLRRGSSAILPEQEEERGREDPED